MTDNFRDSLSVQINTVFKYFCGRFDSWLFFFLHKKCFLLVQILWFFKKTRNKFRKQFTIFPKSKGVLDIREFRREYQFSVGLGNSDLDSVMFGKFGRVEKRKKFRACYSFSSSSVMFRLLFLSVSFQDLFALALPSPKQSFDGRLHLPDIYFLYFFRDILRTDIADLWNRWNTPRMDCVVYLNIFQLSSLYTLTNHVVVFRCECSFFLSESFFSFHFLDPKYSFLLSFLMFSMKTLLFSQWKHCFFRLFSLTPSNWKGCFSWEKKRREIFFLSFVKAPKSTLSECGHWLNWGKE